MTYRENLILTRREKQLAKVLDAIWNDANDAVSAVNDGRASFVNLVQTLHSIAEDAAEALADYPVEMPVLILEN